MQYASRGLEENTATIHALVKRVRPRFWTLYLGDGDSAKTGTDSFPFSLTPSLSVYQLH